MSLATFDLGRHLEARQRRSHPATANQRHVRGHAPTRDLCRHQRSSCGDFHLWGPRRGWLLDNTWRRVDGPIVWLAPFLWWKDSSDLCQQLASQWQTTVGGPSWNATGASRQSGLRQALEAPHSAMVHWRRLCQMPCSVQDLPMRTTPPQYWGSTLIWT